MQRNIVPKKKSYERPREILVETLREILVGAQILRLLHKNRNWSNSSPSSGLRVERSLDKKIARQKHGNLNQGNRLYGIFSAVQDSSISDLVTDPLTTMTTMTAMKKKIHAQENGSRGTNFAKFLTSNFLKGLTYNALATKRREQTNAI